MKLQDYIRKHKAISLAHKLGITFWTLYNWQFKRSKPNYRDLVLLIDHSKGELTFEGVVREVAKW